MNKPLIIFLLFFSVSSFAQNKTINSKHKTEREVSGGHKVLLIPFEPKLYLGEIDYHINAETKLTAKEIKNKFRDGLNEQLFKAFKASKYSVLDLMEDTVRHKRDLEEIYQHLGYDYQRVPNQENYSPPKKEKEEKKIEKGQIIVETDGERRFMNAKLDSPKLLVSFFSKYKTDVFIFINQLDIKSANSAEVNSIGVHSGKRKISAHYTVYNSEGRELNSGLAEEEFEPELNNPKKIIEKHFSRIAAVIVSRVNKSLGSTK